MDEVIWRVARTVLRAPLTRQTRHELVYCGLGGLVGVAGFWVTLVMLVAGLGISASVLGTVVGLLLLTVALRVSRRIGALHRRLLGWLAGTRVEAPPPFRKGSGILNRLDRRLRDRVAWRAVGYSLAKLPVAAVQLYAVTIACWGLIDVTFPIDWVLFWHRPGGGMHSFTAVSPVPFGLSFTVHSWPGTVLAVLMGALDVVVATWLARGITAGDRALVRGLLGPGRVAELERTRALAVDDSAAVLRRVERDLHDGAQMRLAALAMNLGMAREKLADDDAAVRDLLDAAQRNAVDALADLRDLARGIHPPVLDAGLASALDGLAASSAIPASVTAGIGPRPAPAIETIAYFCAAELIANATKHSFANHIEITIHTERAGRLVLRVSDDGVGGAEMSRGSGLSGLAQRVSTVDGRLDVLSPAGGPTAVTVTLPLRAPGGQ